MIISIYIYALGDRKKNYLFRYKIIVIFVIVMEGKLFVISVSMISFVAC